VANSSVDSLQHMLLSLVSFEQNLVCYLVNLQHIKLLASEQKMSMLQLKELSVLDVNICGRVGLVKEELSTLQIL